MLRERPSFGAKFGDIDHHQITSVSMRSRQVLFLVGPTWKEGLRGANPTSEAQEVRSTITKNRTSGGRGEDNHNPILPVSVTPWWEDAIVDELERKSVSEVS